MKEKKEVGKGDAKMNYNKFSQYLAEMVEKYGNVVLSETEGANEVEARYDTECGR